MMMMMNREPKRGPEGQLQLPPGFRFYPSDEELVVHYLCKKAASQPFPIPIIAEVDLYKFDPWDLPEKALFGEKEWYFFSPRDRKYPNGSRPNRAAGSGYWKATGTDKPINGGRQKVGVKKALVFYTGKAPKGDKTNWIMHEYRLADSAAKAAKRKGSLRLDDWVLCRIYKKLPSATRLAMKEINEFEETLASPPEIEIDDDEKMINLPTLSSNPPLINYNIKQSTTPRGDLNFNELHDLQQYANDYAQAAHNNYQQQHHHHHHHQPPPPPPPPKQQEAVHNKPPVAAHDHEMIIKPNSFIPSSRNLSHFPSLPSLLVHNLSPENLDSPVNSSVDEESALPAENILTLPGAISSGMFNHINSGSDSFQLFNFDGLPSPFGRLESFQHFPF